MRRPTLAGWGALAHIAVAVAVAASIAPGVRAFTVELNQSVGRVWPFSLKHCNAPSTPGCDGLGRRPAPYGTSSRHAGRLVREEPPRLPPP